MEQRKCTNSVSPSCTRHEHIDHKLDDFRFAKTGTNLARQSQERQKLMLSRSSIGRVRISVFRLRVTISNAEPTLPDSVPDQKNQPYLMGIDSHALSLEAKSWDKGDAQIRSVQAFPYSRRTHHILPERLPLSQNRYIFGASVSVESKAYVEQDLDRSCHKQCFQT